MSRKIIFITILSLTLFVGVVPAVYAQGNFRCVWQGDIPGETEKCRPDTTTDTCDEARGYAVDRYFCSNLSASQGVCEDEDAIGTCKEPEISIGGFEDPGNASGSSFRLDNPLKAQSVTKLIASIVQFLKMVAGSILVVIILFGAFQIMTSSGNPENIKKGRNTIVWALIGFAIILLASGLGAVIAGILGGTVETLEGTDTATTTDVIGVINTVAAWMYGVLMALGVVFVLYSAFLFLTSGGNQEKVGGARRALVYAIVALAIGVLAWGAESLVTNLLK